MTCEIKKAIIDRCSDMQSPCSITITIGEDMESFNKVVEVFTNLGFRVKDFVDDFMCVLSRENDGINEAIKMNKNQIQIQALRGTLEELSEPLAKYCKEVHY